MLLLQFKFLCTCLQYLSYKTEMPLLQWSAGFLHFRFKSTQVLVQIRSNVRNLGLVLNLCVVLVLHWRISISVCWRNHVCSVVSMKLRTMRQRFELVWKLFEFFFPLQLMFHNIGRLLLVFVLFFFINSCMIPRIFFVWALFILVRIFTVLSLLVMKPTHRFSYQQMQIILT